MLRQLHRAFTIKTPPRVLLRPQIGFVYMLHTYANYSTCFVMFASTSEWCFHGYLESWLILQNFFKCTSYHIKIIYFGQFENWKCCINAISHCLFIPLYCLLIILYMPSYIHTHTLFFWVSSFFFQISVLFSVSYWDHNYIEHVQFSPLSVKLMKFVFWPFMSLLLFTSQKQFLTCQMHYYSLYLTCIIISCYFDHIFFFVIY
jgi:hypothetical protein